jgi:hypothetical protein
VNNDSEVEGRWWGGGAGTLGPASAGYTGHSGESSSPPPLIFLAPEALFLKDRGGAGGGGEAST